jgi:outer membrane protein OmpU
MKKSNVLGLSALAMAAGAVCAPTAAYAQSSVTLYGILDAGVTYVSNAGGSHQVKFDDGISYGNRIGFKGVEDLGGDWQAVFVLESGFHLGNGQLAFGGAQFGRQAYVGLKNSWGTLSLGNQLDMTEEFVYLYNISAWASGYAIHQGDFDRMNGDRLPNSIKFLSNDFSGLTFGGMYSFGNTAGDFHEKSAWSVGAHYEHNAFNMGAAYTQLNDPYGIYAFDPFAMLGVHTFLGQPTVSVDPATGAITDLYSASSFPVDRQGDAERQFHVHDHQGLRADLAYAGLRRRRRVHVHARAPAIRRLPAHAIRRQSLESGFARPALPVVQTHRRLPLRRLSARVGRRERGDRL